MKILNSFQHFGNILSDSKKCCILIFQNWSYLCIYIDRKIKNSTKRLIFLMIFLRRKQLVSARASAVDCFEPIFGFLVQFCFQKPGIPKVCFQHPQWYTFVWSSKNHISVTLLKKTVFEKIYTYVYFDILPWKSTIFTFCQIQLAMTIIFIEISKIP